LAAALAGACGGSVGKTPSIGSESHFLAHCEASCEGGLDCIGGICTRPCLTEQSSCSDLAAAASCTNQSVEPGEVAVCDLSCAGSADCRVLGSSFTCQAGFCRQPAETDAVSSTLADAGARQEGPLSSPGPECEAFQDQVPPPDMRAISILNAGSVPLYIFPVFLDCDAPTSLVQVERDGKAVNTLGIGELGPSCEQVRNLEGSSPTPSERALCKMAPALRIDPGQTLEQPVGLEVVEQQLPLSCAKPTYTGSRACFSRVIPQPGTYTLTIHAALSNECAPRGVCLCDLEGQCNTSDPPLVFSFPSPWYFQNQELRISAPMD